jgi:hypothetical protein
VGAALGGALSSATSDAIPYLGLATICLVTLSLLAGSGAVDSKTTVEPA